MQFLGGIFFIIVGVSGILITISTMKKMKRIKEDSYEANSIIEKIDFLPDSHRETLPEYQITVKYIDIYGVSHLGKIVLPLLDIKIGDSIKIFINKNNSKLISYVEDNYLFHTFLITIVLALLILLGLWLVFSDIPIVQSCTS